MCTNLPLRRINKEIHFNEDPFVCMREMIVYKVFRNAPGHSTKLMSTVDHTLFIQDDINEGSYYCVYMDADEALSHAKKITGGLVFECKITVGAKYFIGNAGDNVILTDRLFIGRQVFSHI